MLVSIIHLNEDKESYIYIVYIFLSINIIHMLLVVNNSNENDDIIKYIKTRKKLASKLNSNYKMTQELKKF